MGWSIYVPAWSADATPGCGAGVKEGSELQFCYTESWIVQIIFTLACLWIIYMQEMNHLTREAGSQSCCSVLNASYPTSQGPLLVRKLLKHKWMHKGLKIFLSHCKNWIAVAGKEKKRRKDRVEDANITAQKEPQTHQGLTQHSSELRLLACYSRFANRSSPSTPSPVTNTQLTAQTGKHVICTPCHITVLRCTQTGSFGPSLLQLLCRSPTDKVPPWLTTAL